MARADRPSTAPGPDRLVTYGVSHVAALLCGVGAHTMALCGLGEVRSVRHVTVTRSP
jgi:hypothetical protein